MHFASRRQGFYRGAVVALQLAWWPFDKIYADDLKAATVDASVSGNGKTTVWATDELKVNASGRGKVEYKGKPRIDQSISDEGSIKSIDD